MPSGQNTIADTVLPAACSTPDNCHTVVISCYYLLPIDSHVARNYNLNPVHTSNNVEATLSSTLLPFGNKVKRVFFREISSFRQIRNVQFVSNLSKGLDFVRQQCRSNVRLCRKNRSNCIIRQCCFDVVAGVDCALSSVSLTPLTAVDGELHQNGFVVHWCTTAAVQQSTTIHSGSTTNQKYNILSLDMSCCTKCCSLQHC